MGGSMGSDRPRSNPKFATFSLKAAQEACTQRQESPPTTNQPEERGQVCIDPKLSGLRKPSASKVSQDYASDTTRDSPTKTCQKFPSC